jgi:hypothetical protein
VIHSPKVVRVENVENQKILQADWFSGLRHMETEMDPVCARVQQVTRHYKPTAQ